MRSLQRGEVIAIALGIILAGWFFIFGTPFETQKEAAPQDQAATASGALQGNQTNVTTETNTAGGLVITDEVLGTGATATNGKTVSVHYVGTFTNGQKFDSSIDNGTPFEFVLGAGQVIPGWDKGVLGMKVGGKRKLIVPSDLGYGDSDYGPIPGKSTLVFEIQLLNVK